MKIHVLHCGYIRVSEAMLYGNALGAKMLARLIAEPDSRRVTLPVCAYLIEHRGGLLLVDTGWTREISPDGVYDPKAASRLLPGYLAKLYRPWVPEGMAVHEQLAAMGIKPENLDCVVITHLDPEHVSGVRHVNTAKRIVLPEDEYFWSCRTVFKSRQVWSLWMDQPITREYYHGFDLGPNKWAIDLMGDESIMLVNVPGYTDGQCAVLLREGKRFAVLAADAAFSPRNWQEMITPGFGFGKVWQQKSLKWLADMASDLNCAAVLCSHDPDLKPQTIEI